MCRRMARKIGIKDTDVLNYFRERGSYSISVEVKEEP